MQPPQNVRGFDQIHKCGGKLGGTGHRADCQCIYQIAGFSRWPNTPIRATFQEIIVADWFGYRELIWYYLMNAINQVSRSSFDRTSRLGLRIRTCVLGVQRPDQASRGEVIFRWAAQEYWVTCKKTIIIFLPIHYQSLLLSKSTGHVGRGTLHSEAKVSLKLH